VPGEAYGIWRDTIEAAPDKMFDRVRERFRAGGAVSAPDFVAAARRLNQVRRSWLAETAAYDAVILPSVACLPADIDRLMSDADYYVSENLMTLRNARIGNMLGLCGLTLPTGCRRRGSCSLRRPWPRSACCGWARRRRRRWPERHIFRAESAFCWTGTAAPR
jgi:aspartyl-tRNA(Asn)/glutamyl-tRNA(Gln) amidotransferase subunit A